MKSFSLGSKVVNRNGETGEVVELLSPFFVAVYWYEADRETRCDIGTLERKG